GRLREAGPSLSGAPCVGIGLSPPPFPWESAIGLSHRPSLGNRQSGIGNRPLPTALPLGIGNREWGIGTAGVVRRACRSRASRGASRRALPKGVARFPQALSHQAQSPLPSGRRRRPLPGGAATRSGARRLTSCPERAAPPD